ncbi:MAG: 6-phosphofructokinase [Candidatus Zixiibacteriota bacterium]
MSKKVAILTGGGDCPGLNAVIRAAVYRGIKEYGFEIVGLLEGWRGLLEKKTRKLEIKDVADIVSEGGTILGTSRTNPVKSKESLEKAVENFKELGLDCIIVIGGDDTNTAGYELSKQGLNIVGVPKTIDNDLSATDVTFGFDTAINIAMDSIDRIRTTARSHNRVFVIELMGRHAGWITLEAGVAGAADIILLPEEPFSMDDLIDKLREIRDNGKNYAIVAVSEGARLSVSANDSSSLFFKDLEKDEFGHVRLGGIAGKLSEEIQDELDWESRSVVLGHTQRGGAPSAFDRFLSTRFGSSAMAEVARENYGVVVCLQGADIVPVKLGPKVLDQKLIPEKYLQYASLFGARLGKIK